MKKVILLFMAIMVTCVTWGQVNGDFQTKSTTGNWSDFNAWNIRSGGVWIAATSGQIPLATSSVYVQSGHTISVDDANAVCATLNVNGASTSKVAFSMASSILNVKGDLVVFSTTANPFGTWTAGAKIAFSGTGAQTITNMSASFTLNNIEINKSAGTFTWPAANVKFDVVTLTAGTVAVGSSAELRGLSASSTVTINGGSWTQTTGATKINGGASGTNIALAINAGSMTLATTSGSPAGFNFSTVTVSNGGTLTFTNSNGFFGIGTSISVDGTSTFNMGLGSLTLPASVTFGGTVDYNYAGTQTINDVNYSNLKISGGSGTKSWSLASTRTVSGNLTLASGTTLALSTNNLSISGSFSLAGTLTLASLNFPTVAGTVTGGTAAAVSFTGAGAGSTSFPGIALNSLTINRTGGYTVNLGGPVTVGGSGSGVLTLTAGFINTTSSNSLTVTNTAAGGITGGSVTSYVNGPLARTFPNNATSATYTFPVGRSAYNAFDLIPMTTGGTGTGTIKLEVFDAAPSGGTAGFGMATINAPSSRYWQLTNNLGTVTLTSASIRINETGMTNGTHKIAKSSTVGGAYDNIGGTIAVAPTQITSFTQNAFSGFYVLGTAGTLSGGIFEVGADQVTYKKLGDVANMLNNTTLTGNVIFELNSTYNGANETLPITFNQITYSGGPYLVTIRPKSGVTGKSITGSNGTAIIDLNGGDNFILDGRAGGSGSTVGGDLTIENTTLVGFCSTFRFGNDASSNVLRYCTLKGFMNSTGYVVNFIGGTTTGNLNNTVEYCNITKASTGSPDRGISSSGTAAIPNSGIIRYCYISDFVGKGIGLESNNATWSITNNHIYQTTTATATSQYGIQINSGQTACVATISNNYIGGSSINAGGTWINSAASTIYPLHIISHSTASSSTITNNTIQNFSQTNATTSALTFIGLNISGTGLHSNISGNVISNVTQPNTTSTSSKVGGILNGNSTAGSIIQSNIVHDLSTLSRLSGDVTSITAVTAYGIISNTAAANQTISQNTIYNIGASSTGAYNTGVVGIGIDVTGSTGTVARNRIYGLTNTCTGTANGIAGIRVYMGSWTYANNQISITNGANTNFCRVFGIIDNGTSNNWYYNSVYVGGATSGTAHSGAFADYYAGTRTVNLRNNIFYNERSGGGLHYCIYMSATPSIFSTNYNLFVPVTDATTGYSGGSAKTFAQWKALGSNTYDQNSVSEISSNVTSASLFTSTSAGDLSIKTGFVPINNKADNTTGIADDYKATGSRGSTPDIGSDEFAMLAAVTTGTPAISITSTGATLPGTVNANNESATGTFEYGLTPSYGLTSSWTPSPATGTGNTAVSAVLGSLVPNSTYYYRINAVTPKGTANGAEMTFVTSAAPALAIWTGTTDNDWFKPSNWNTDVPYSSTDVTIPVVSNYPTLTSAGTCHNISIASGASLLDNSNLTVTGTATVERDITNAVWHLISVPNNNTTANTFLGDYMQTWDETQALWTDIKDPLTALNPVEGYDLWNMTGATKTYTFTGALNTGNQSKAITYTNLPATTNDGANLLGNPYPSYINWDELRTTYGAVYYFNGTAYVSWNAGGSGSQFVAPLQGFYIVTATNGTFSLTNSNRAHSNAAYYKSGSEIASNSIVLETRSKDYSDKLFVNFNPQATEGFDLQHDAYKFTSETSGLSQLYSFTGEKKLSIDARPACEIIQLGFINDQPGVYQIGISEVADISNSILEDTKTGIFTDLLKGPYSFSYTPGENEQRFVLHFGTLSVNETENDVAAIYASHGIVYVDLKNNVEGDIFIYNISGQLVASVPGAQGSSKISLVNTGNYIVKVISNRSTMVKKVFVQ